MKTIIAALTLNNKVVGVYYFVAVQEVPSDGF